MRLLRALPQLFAVLATLLFAAVASAQELTVYFFDVGQGDGMLIVSPAGKTVLIDAGPPQAGPHVAERLKKILNAPLDLIVMTHPHLDHLGGLEDAVRAVGARIFLEPEYSHPSPAYEQLLTALNDKKVELRHGEDGNKIGLGGGAQLMLLAPRKPLLDNTRSDANANSIVAKLTFGQTSFLFTGDSEAETEARVMEHEDLHANVLKVAHHGSRHSSGAEFLAKVKPEIAVISCGMGNDYGHPTRPALDRLDAIHAKTYRTDLDGEIVVKSDGKKVWVTTEKGGTKEPMAAAEQPAGEKKVRGHSPKDNDSGDDMGASASKGKGDKKGATFTSHKTSEGSSGEGGTYIASKRSEVFHKANCRAAGKIKPDNVVSYSSRDQAVADGKRPAADCDP